MWTFGDIWRRPGDILWHFRTFVDICGHLETFVDIWRHLMISQDICDILGHFLTFGDICGHLSWGVQNLSTSLFFFADRLPSPVSKWSEKNKCSETCGGGTQSRFRFCIGGEAGDVGCQGLVEEVSPCATELCPVELMKIIFCRNLRCQNIKNVVF